MWKPVKGYEGYYEINQNGLVKRVDTQQYVVEHKNHKGYMKVNLNLSGVRKGKAVHRLVAEAFVDNIHDKPFVNHIDGDKFNNSASNLEWVTDSENKLHAFKNGLISKVGSRNGNSKLTEEDITKARTAYLNGITTKELALAYGVHQTTIQRAISGKRYWKNV